MPSMTFTEYYQMQTDLGEAKTRIKELEKEIIFRDKMINIIAPYVNCHFLEFIVCKNDENCAECIIKHCRNKAKESKNDNNEKTS